MKTFRTDDQKWTAVKKRDRDAEGQFFYSVRTTGVYCRPSCASRTARRENVRFHKSWQDAEAAGFRPCKRCRPKDSLVDDQQTELVTRACRMIETSSREPNLNSLAKAAGMSPFHFHRVFKSVTGLTPKAYATAQKTKNMKSKLLQSGTVTQAIYQSGFNSNGQFYTVSPKVLGMTPKNFRAGGNGITIQFAIAQSSLGKILVAATERGVCAIMLGTDPNYLKKELQSDFPRAKLVAGDGQFQKWVDCVIEFVEMPRSEIDHLPLDIRGTAFQQRVWQALRKIPIGSTTTYTEIAKQIGSPKSIRAVARACATNHISLAIPCHRVVRTDGSLAGYRWGIERKQELIKREKNAKQSKTKTASKR